MQKDTYTHTDTVSSALSGKLSLDRHPSALATPLWTRAQTMVLRMD